ncbi:MAG: hypothetical protein KGJ43_00350 [Acidobacteriota bacterium]|nr:hypothetical protein [Acidobacteriota bacterium]
MSNGRSPGVRETAFVLGLVLLLAPQPAAAAAPRAVASALQAARSYWHAAPCAGKTAVRWSSDPPASPVAGTEVVAWVTFETPRGPESFAAAPADFTACTVHVSRARWADPAAGAADYPRFCQMMVHEVGHLLGWADSLSYAPSDIRYPVLSAANMPAVCSRPMRGPGAGGPAPDRSFEH